MEQSSTLVDFVVSKNTQGKNEFLRINNQFNLTLFTLLVTREHINKFAHGKNQFPSLTKSGWNNKELISTQLSHKNFNPHTLENSSKVESWWTEFDQDTAQ